jgi:adenylate cyclase class 1
MTHARAGGELIPVNDAIIMNDIFSLGRILQLRNAFVTYNISRVRELIRYLPPKKFELFQNIPFWLHLNMPGIPGFIDSPKTPSGIYRFHASGFWREGVRRFKGNQKELLRHSAGKGYVLGMYLMGSSGTLAQSDQSDFDYWIVVNSKDSDAEAQALFQEKINGIETWSRERYNQEVKLFVLRPVDVRENEFSAVDEDSSGSSQRSFLKEEFYRTFIMIAGQIPFWAVTPSRLGDVAYDQWVHEAAGIQSLKFFPEDYIDLGNLKTINRQECLGAILWQLFKAGKYPVKSLIKAGLVAHYFFSTEKEGLLCDRIREGFSDSTPGNPLIDPYAIVFKTVIDFFSSMEDAEGLLLVKECIFFRLSETSKSVQAGNPSPKQALLKRYLAQWQWRDAKIEKMAMYHLWSEPERLAFEYRIFKKITFLYELILRAHLGATPDVFMKTSDLLSLKNNIAAALKKKPGKIPPCSAYLRTHGAKLVFQISDRKADDDRECWVVYNKSGRSLDLRHVVFRGPQLLRTLGWLLANGFYPCGLKQIEFQTVNLPISPRRIRDLLEEIYLFFSKSEVVVAEKRDAPKWDRIIILPRALPNRADGLLGGADFLVVNSWGEIFFESVELSFINSLSSQCHKISEHIWKYSRNAKAYTIPYCVLELGKGIGSVHRRIESGLNSFMPRISSLNPANPEIPEAEDEKEDPPLLDLVP